MNIDFNRIFINNFIIIIIIIIIRYIIIEKQLLKFKEKFIIASKNHVKNRVNESGSFFQGKKKNRTN